MRDDPSLMWVRLSGGWPPIWYENERGMRERSQPGNSFPLPPLPHCQHVTSCPMVDHILSSHEPKPAFPFLSCFLSSVSPSREKNHPPSSMFNLDWQRLMMTDYSVFASTFPPVRITAAGCCCVTSKLHKSNAM